MVSLHYEWSCEPLSYLTGKRTLYTWCRRKTPCHCVSYCESSRYHWPVWPGFLWTWCHVQRKPGHTGGGETHVSPQDLTWLDLSQVFRHGERVCTLARIGSFATVCPFVPLQAPILRESLVTLGAGVRFFFGVNSHVNPQVLWTGGEGEVPMPSQ